MRCFLSFQPKHSAIEWEVGALEFSSICFLMHIFVGAGKTSAMALHPEDRTKQNRYGLWDERFRKNRIMIILDIPL